MDRMSAIDAMYEAKRINNGLQALGYLMSVAGKEGPALGELAACIYSLHECMGAKLEAIEQSLK